MPDYESGRGASDRRRSLFGRLRGRRDPPPPAYSEEPERPSFAGRPPGRGEPEYDDFEPEDYDEREVRSSPPPVAAPSRRRESAREPRHVRAIPTSAEQKFAAAIDVFNGTEHRRTVAGVARSLGRPTVAVAPGEASPGLVRIVVSWELCWYRYEIDLSEDAPGVRVEAQGYELDELQEAERRPNAVADENGTLSLAV